MARLAHRSSFVCARARRIALFALVLVAVARPAPAQIFQRSVGGVVVNAEGVLRNIEIDERALLRDAREKALQQVPGDLAAKSELRMVSLRRLEDAIAQQQKDGQPLPDEIKYLAGLLQIRYVFVVPEAGDIVLAGPAEGWKINDAGEVIGQTTGWPVLRLDDLLVALRTAEAARQTGLTCSIDPTAAGLERLQEVAKTSVRRGANPAAVSKAAQEALGAQTISVGGLPADSHFAQVLVAADFRMKRLAMHFDRSPVKGLPSFLELAKAGPAGVSNMLPRWWLAPKYDALLTDPDRLSWEIRSPGVQCKAEDDFLAENGQRQHTGQASAAVQDWATRFTDNYEKLATQDAIFAQLRNCMDLAVVGALVAKEQMLERAGHSLPLLYASGDLKHDEFPVPKHVDSQASFLQKGKNWLISVSGGVEIDSWKIAEAAQTDGQLAHERAKATGPGTSWWWD